ncbi:MAG: alanine racemase [Sulfurovum sp.]|nr:alanine racemase [Sulfurovum sp.]
MAIIKINKENFFHNLNQIALKTGSIDKIAVVLKDNAYGHGLEIMAKLSAEFGIKQAVVIDTEEAMQARDYFSRILVLKGKPIEEKKFSFVVSDMQTLEGVGTRAKIELKVDTGMHRNGIAICDLEKALRIIKLRDMNLVGIMTHFRSADILSSELFWQKQLFNRVKIIAKESGLGGVRFHSHNSAAVFRAKSFDEDIARVGIAIYGGLELDSAYAELNLKPVLSLWAKRISTRVLKKGQRVGYAGDFRAEKNMTTSTYDLGYGDGWMRGDSSRPYMTAEGLPILGRVSMDFVSLESDADEVCIMTDARTAAKHYDSISYEMTTMLSMSIDRVVV